MTRPASTPSAPRALEIARELFFYAYPLVLMDITRQQMTNYAEPPAVPPGAGPLNRLVHIREFPDPRFRVVVRPNLDTLYSSAWLDLAAGPMVLSIPPVERYYMMPLLSMWTDVFAVPGTRTTGEGVPGHFAIAERHFRGELPTDVRLIRSPTRYVWLIGRTQTNGKSDYRNVHAIQDGYRLTPLSEWGASKPQLPKGKIVPSIDTDTPPPFQVARMDADAFYARFSALLQDNPPYFFDYPLLQQLERLGLRSGRPFVLSEQPEPVRAAIERGFRDGVAELDEELARLRAAKNWQFSARGGCYGNMYRLRAVVAKVGLGANLEQDACYASVGTDGEGRALHGESRYVLRFPRGTLPPVNAFWSVTVYDRDGYLYPNSIGRCALGDRDHLSFGADGALELVLQNEPPVQQSNWLPVPMAPFNLLLRMYWPGDAILTRSWQAPPLTRLK